ncbi:MAG: TRAP transporter small permease [Candidatus Competibacteraceae bacterium]|nr:TRAP transporter small permease [Candidatus Competibacteraceae bacterium]
MTTVMDGYFKFLKIVIAICLLVMVVLVFGNVVLRYAFNSGISLSEELSRWFFVWMTFIGGLVGLHERSHLGFDMFVNHLGAVGRKICLILSLGLMIYCCLVLLKGSWAQTVINLDVRAPTSGLSMAFIYGMGVFFAINALVVLLLDLYRALFGRMTEAELVMVRETQDQPEELPHDDTDNKNT